MTDAARLVDPELWMLPLDQRMAEIADIRTAGHIHEVEIYDEINDQDVMIKPVIGFDEVVHMSKNPADFCSGQGATSVVDLTAEMLEYFGGFINMDDPRHHRQRTIVAKTFTPRSLQSLLDSVETTCIEVIDSFCEKGEVDLVEALSQPFPLLVICDMMGIPRSDFDRVLKATNTILGAGDPDFLDGKDPIEAAVGAGLELVMLMHELAEYKKKNPGDDITSKLVNTEFEEDILTPDELGSFFILLAVAGNDTTRNSISYGIDLLTRNPDQRQLLLDDLDGVGVTATEEIVRVGSPVTFMRRTATRDMSLNDYDISEGDRMVLMYGAANRDPKTFDNPETFDVTRHPNPHVGFGGPGPHFCLGAHLARREMQVMLKQLYTRLPDIETTGTAVPLSPRGLPLVAGIKHLPVSFTPAAPSGANA